MVVYCSPLVAVRMSTEATAMAEGDGRWSSQRPLPHGTSDEPLWIRPDSRTWTLQC